MFKNVWNPNPDWHCLIAIKLWTTKNLPLRRTWEQRNKSVGNEDTEKEAADYLTKYKTGEREGEGGKGGQKRSKSRNQPVRAESHAESHCTISFGLEDSRVTGYKLCRGAVAGVRWLRGGCWQPAPPGPRAALPEPCSRTAPRAGTGPSCKVPTTLVSSHKLLVTAKPTGKRKQKMWLHLKQASTLLRKGS